MTFYSPKHYKELRKGGASLIDKSIYQINKDDEKIN